MPAGRVLRQDDRTSESLSAKATKDLDRSLLNALTAEEGGILQAGALPAVRAATESGQKALLNALDDDNKTVAKVKKAAKPKVTDGEPVVPKTVLESGPQIHTGHTFETSLKIMLTTL